MEKDRFIEYAANENNPKWDKLIGRKDSLYKWEDEVRSEFFRDYTRIINSLAYRRMKDKTQVFYNVDNDHICTRIEHVSHVDSVAETIGKYIGLNCELIKAIATGHDMGHAPFGHYGEKIIDEIMKDKLGENFWHERNGLYLADDLELLEDYNRNYRNLNLTYAVRDGIISHCGEVDENGLVPRQEYIDLADFTRPGEYMAYTWEGCVVKISDKIAYLGRDIEDALRLHFIDDDHIKMLSKVLRVNQQTLEKQAESMNQANFLNQSYYTGTSRGMENLPINTTNIIHNMLIDICRNSNPDDGIRLSNEYFEELNIIKKYNYEYICVNKRFVPYEKYAKLIINQIFSVLDDCYDSERTLVKLVKESRDYPELMGEYAEWLLRYIEPQGVVIPDNMKERFADIISTSSNKKVYGTLATREIYEKAILDYISGMTDRYAVKVFQELLIF